MNDSVKAYFKDIKKIPLLSAEEEIDLANRIKLGDNKAKDMMIKSNLRLVINFAKRYRNFDIPLMDLIEEGNMGLMKAVTKFNPKRGYRFSTYASWWIRQYINRALANQGKIIRLPVYMVENILRYKKTSEDLTYKLGRKPSQAEIARKMKVPVAKLNQIDTIVTKITSLEAPIGENQTGQVGDLIEDETAQSADHQLAEFMAKEKIEELLSKMKPRERQIIELRYGLVDDRKYTLEEAAKKYGLTRERVRQIEEATLKKLKKIIIKEEKTNDEKSKV
jgi:RNA polymerase primary sigma factor